MYVVCLVGVHLCMSFDSLLRFWIYAVDVNVQRWMCVCGSSRVCVSRIRIRYGYTTNMNVTMHYCTHHFHMSDDADQTFILTQIVEVTNPQFHWISHSLLWFSRVSGSFFLLSFFIHIFYHWNVEWARSRKFNESINWCCVCVFVCCAVLGARCSTPVCSTETVLKELEWEWQEKWHRLKVKSHALSFSSCSFTLLRCVRCIECAYGSIEKGSRWRSVWSVCVCVNAILCRFVRCRAATCTSFRIKFFYYYLDRKCAAEKKRMKIEAESVGKKARSKIGVK